MQEKWKTVGIVDNENMIVPHVLQQKMQYIKMKEVWRLRDEHRLVSINELEGVNND